MSTPDALTEVVELDRPASADVQVVSADPRVEALLVLPGTLTVLAYVPREGDPEAHVALKVDGNFVTVTLTRAMTKEQIFEAFAAAMPPGFEALTNDTQSEILILSILRVPSKTSTLPHVMFASTDPLQRFLWKARNKFTIEGNAARAALVRSIVHLTVDGFPVKVVLMGGETPVGTATKLQQARPVAYDAMLELPVVGDAAVAVTGLRR
jgi:hypothetical protein